MSFDKFAKKIEGVRQQTNLLQNSVNQVPDRQQELLTEAVEQLNISLEELNVAQEELIQQNEELELTRQEVDKERQRYQELFDFAPDGYLVTDINGKILEANQAASQLFAVTKDRLYDKLLICFVPSEARRRFRNQLHDLCEEIQLQDWEICLQNNQGISFDCEISTSIISDKNGNCIGIRWLLRNINARKQAEEKARFIEIQNLHLREAAQLKSKIVSVLSHELRTPLNAVLGFSDVLLRLNKNQFTPQSITIVETIIKNGKQLLALITNMLDFARLEEGEFKLSLQQFNIIELTKIITEELRFLANQKKISLDVSINIKNVKVINDPVRLQQLLTNLISNAIKFTENGSVFVELYELNEDKIIIIVKDTGIGILELDLRYIFQAFRQVNQTKTRPYQGTGIGLAIVKDLLDLMGGAIDVESVPGEGSTFRVELPREVKSIIN